MQVKAHRELDARPPGQRLFAAQIVALGAEIKLARVAEAEAVAVPSATMRVLFVIVRSGKRETPTSTTASGIIL